MEKIESTLKNHKVYIDVLKILSILFVIFNHTGSNGFAYFLDNRDTFLYWIYMAISEFIKIAVPIFLMCSGALLLGKKESYRTHFNKRILKYVVILFVVSAFYYLTYYRDGNIIDFIKLVYSSLTSTHLWFLHLYLAYLIILPFLRMIAEKMKNSDFKYLIIVYSVFRFLTIIEFLVWKEESLINDTLASSIMLLSEVVFYPLVGFYIDQKLDKKCLNKKTLIKLIVLSILIVIMICLLTNYRCVIKNAWTEETAQYFLNTLIYIPAITTFCCFKKLFEKISIKEKSKALIFKIAKYTFIVYLIAPLITELFGWLYDVFKPYIGLWFSAIVISLVIYFISLIIILLESVIIDKLIRKSNKKVP